MNSIKKTFIFIVFLGILIFIFSFSDLLKIREAKAVWYSTGGTWTYRKSITIDHTKVPDTDSSGGEINFPVLIDVTDSDLATYAKSDGYDILFTSSDGSTKLSHEREIYTSATGRLTAWVKIPSLSSTVDTVIYTYYGNSGASDQQNITGTWDANYKGVWHLKETVTDEATGGTHYDSTSAANNATQYRNVKSAGKVGDGQYFDGTADYLTINSDVSNWLSFTEGTVSLWYKSDGTPSFSTFFNADSGAGDSLAFSVYYGPLLIYHRADYGTENYVTKTIDDVTTDTNWHYAVGTWKVGGSPYTLSLLYDSSSPATDTDTLSTPSAFGGTASIAIAADQSSAPFKGTLDEIRISNIRRTNDWLTTEYNNQSATSTFYQYGDSESQPVEESVTSSNVKVRSGDNTGNSSSVKVRGGVKFR